MASVVALVVAYANVAPGAATPVRQTELPRPSAPLHKPEPQSLLQVQLSESQRVRISGIVDQWNDEKRAHVAAMDQMRPSQGRMDQLTRSLGSYSELSRAYDRRRQHYWHLALKVLTSVQQKEVQR